MIGVRVCSRIEAISSDGSVELRVPVYGRRIFGVNPVLELAPFFETGQVFEGVTQSPVDDLHIDDSREKRRQGEERPNEEPVVEGIDEVGVEEDPRRRSRRRADGRCADRRRPIHDRGHRHPGQRHPHGDDDEDEGQHPAMMRGRRSEDRLQEPLKGRPLFSGNPDHHPGRDGQEREHDEGPDHHAGRFVDMMRDLRRHSRPAGEREEEEAEAIERGQERAAEQERPEKKSLVKGRGQDLVLREEPSEGRQACQGRRPDEHGDGRGQHAGGQAAHLAEILLPAQPVDDAAGAKEQQGLEEGVRDQVEDGGGVRPQPCRREHVAELTDGRIGEHALDVGLHEADGGREHSGQHADPGHHFQGRARALEQGAAATHHVDARRDHGGRVDERGDGRRPLHGVGQPDVQGQLSRFPAGPGEEEERDARGHRGG